MACWVTWALPRQTPLYNGAFIVGFPCGLGPGLEHQRVSVPSITGPSLSARRLTRHRPAGPLVSVPSITGPSLSGKPLTAQTTPGRWVSVPSITGPSLSESCRRSVRWGLVTVSVPSITGPSLSGAGHAWRSGTQARGFSPLYNGAFIVGGSVATGRYINDLEFQSPL